MDSPNRQDQENECNSLISQSHGADQSQAGPSTQVPQSCNEPNSISTLTENGQELPSTSQPTRGSQRPRKCPKVLSYESFKDSHWEWSERDKKLFLAGCLEVGTENIEGLKDFLPHKNEFEIKGQIRMWKDYASRNVEQNLSRKERRQLRNLDDWIDYFKEQFKFSNGSNFTLFNVFSNIAEFGKFPPPEECGGIDVRAMYRYLHCIMNGIPPYGLNKVTAKAIYTCINNVMKKLDDPNLKERQEQHFSSRSVKSEEWRKKFGKTYSRKRKKRPTNIQDLINNPIMNPLGLPQRALVLEYSREEDSSEED